MEANKPYNKITSNENWTDGVWDGIGYGIGAGAATLGAFHGGMTAYGSKGRAENLADQSTGVKAMLANAEAGTKKHAKFTARSEKIDGKIERQNKFNAGKKLGGWRGVAAYGGSALVGGIAGGTIDHFNGS